MLTVRTLHSLQGLPVCFSAIADRYLRRVPGIHSYLFSVKDLPTTYLNHIYRFLYGVVLLDQRYGPGIDNLINSYIPTYVGVSSVIRYDALVSLGNLSARQKQQYWDWYVSKWKERGWDWKLDWDNTDETNITIFFVRGDKYIGVRVSPDEADGYKLAVVADWLNQPCIGDLFLLATIALLKNGWIKADEQQSVVEFAEGAAPTDVVSFFLEEQAEKNGYCWKRSKKHCQVEIALPSEKYNAKFTKWVRRLTDPFIGYREAI